MQVRHPAQDVGLTAQLLQAVHARVMGAEIAQEVANCPTIVTSGVGTECNAKGIDCAVEGRSERMLEGRAACAVHAEIWGRGRMRCATTRAYSR